MSKANGSARKDKPAVSRQREYQIEMARNGRCRYCGQKAVAYRRGKTTKVGVRCGFHAAQHREQERERARARARQT